MDYSLIKRVATQKGISLKMLAENAGITAQGFHGYVKKNTMPIIILENICAQLNISLVQAVSNDEQIKEETNREIFELLRENRELRQQIERLEKKYQKIEGTQYSVNEPAYKSKLK